MTVRKILLFSIGPIGAAFLGLITLPIVAWFFSAEDIGRLAMLQITVGFALLLFSLGLDQAYVREFHEVEDKPALLKTVFIPGLFMLSLAVMFLALSPWSLSLLLFGVDSLFLTNLLYAAVFLSLFSRFLGLILRMQERGMAFSMSQLLPKLLFLFIVLVYVWMGSDSVFENLMLANFFSLLAVFLVFAWNTHKEWLPAFSASIDKTKQAQMIRYAIPLIGSGLAFWGLTSMDKLFIRSLSSFQELGVYSIAVSFAGAALVFQAIFSTVWAPVVYKWVAEGVDQNRIKNVIDYMTLAVVVIWSVAGMLSWLISFILPSDYYQVQYILLAAMAYPLLYTLSEATGIGIGVKRKTVYSFLAALIALGFNALGNWFLIPIYGAAGAAMASAIAFFIFFTIRTEVSSKLWKSFERWKMYLLLVVLLVLSILINAVQIRPEIISSLYVIMIVTALLLYKCQAQSVYGYIMKSINSSKRKPA